MNHLEDDFHREMQAIYRRALFLYDYRASRFHQMVRTHGGVETARKLMQTGPDSEQDGLNRLVRNSGIDGLSMSVESLVLKQKFRPLFTAEECQCARDRLSRLMQTV
jgi:hypothetical protein